MRFFSYLRRKYLQYVSSKAVRQGNYQRIPKGRCQHVRADGLRGYGLYKSRDYGTKEVNTRVYHIAGAERDIRVWQQSEGNARRRYRKFGAIMGQGVGLQGQSYAIPTMQGGVETIRPYVDEFIQFAKQHLELTFLVTRIGCGIAGFTDDEISPLFAEAHGVENIVLPPNW